MKPNSAYTVAILCIVVLAIVCTALLASHQNALTSHFGKDVFKLLFQFFLILVLGGAISLIFKEFGSDRAAARTARERQQLKEEAQREAAKLLSQELIEIYNDSKRIRRLLRARPLVLTPETGPS